jgi:hypothetical protein
MSIIVYWLCVDDRPHSAAYSDKELVKALDFVKILREDGMRHVCISSELECFVGKPGVDVTGADYDWKKRHV